MASVRRLLVVLSVLAIALVGVTAPASAGGGGHGGSGGPVILPPNSRPYGASFAEWTARWWQWSYGTDIRVNPVFDNRKGAPQQPIPVSCRAGQQGPVWFLGGTYLPTDPTSTPPSSTVYRSCRIPAGVALFFPVLNSEFDNLACPPGPATDYTAAQLAAAAHFSTDHAGAMQVTIDGTAVPGLTDVHTAFRSTSPWFAYRLPRFNVGRVVCAGDFPAGTRPPTVDGHPGAIADGVYVMVAPLSRGTHTFHVGGKIDIPATPIPPAPAGPFEFEQDINYVITVG